MLSLWQPERRLGYVLRPLIYRKTHTTIMAEKYLTFFITARAQREGLRPSRWNEFAHKTPNGSLCRFSDTCFLGSETIQTARQARRHDVARHEEKHCELEWMYGKFRKQVESKKCFVGAKGLEERNCLRI